MLVYFSTDLVKFGKVWFSTKLKWTIIWKGGSSSKKNRDCIIHILLLPGLASDILIFSLYIYIPHPCWLCPVHWWLLMISLKQQFWIPSFRKRSLRITGTGSPKEEQNLPPIMLIGCDLILRHKGGCQFQAFSQGSSVDFCWFFC